MTNKTKTKTHTRIFFQALLLEWILLTPLLIFGFYKTYDTNPIWLKTLAGFFASAILASLNLVLLFFTFKSLEQQKRNFFSAILGFIVLILGAFLVKSSSPVLFGYALGLTSPLIFACCYFWLDK